MKQILEIARKHKLYMLSIFFLLILESLCFILLPIYISNIFDVGIKKKGISEPIPIVLSVRSMNALNALNKNEDIKKYYELIKKGDESYINKYEILKREDLYLLKPDINKKSLKELLLKSESLHYLLSSSEELTSRGFKPDESVINYYLGLPEDNEIKKIYSSVDNMDYKSLKENAIKFVISEYSSIQYNADQIQKNYIIKHSLFIVIISILIISIIIVNNNISLKILEKKEGQLLNVVVTGSFIGIGSIVGIILIDIPKIIWLIITTMLFLFIAILYKYLTNTKRIPKLNKTFIQKIIKLSQILALIIIDVIYIIIITNKSSQMNNIISICYTINYTAALLIVLSCYTNSQN